MHSPLRARKQTAEYAMEASIISCSKEINTQPSARKLMLTVFWDSQGPILETYQERGTIVTSATYCDMLQRELKPAIRSKIRGKLSKEVLLLHDNARPHTTANTLETLKQLKREDMEHPPYSPDLAPSDFHLYGPLKDALRGRRFSCDDDVKAAVHQWLRAQPKTFFADGFKKLVGR